MNEFIGIAEIAPEEDKEVMDVLIDHEVALAKFARLEVNQDPSSITFLNEFLTNNALKNSLK